MKTKKLKIAMLSLHSSPIGRLGTNDTGGMSVCIREVAGALGNRGHSVDIFTRLGEPASRQILELSHNVRLILLRSGKEGQVPKTEIYPLMGDLFHELERFRRHEALRYDCVHSHYWLSGMVGEQAQRRWGIPHVITFHTLGALKNELKGVEREPMLRVMTEREIATSCHSIIAFTEREKEDLIRYYAATPDRIKVVPCGVNPRLFRPMDKMNARKRLGLNGGEALLLYVGRFVPSKGVDRLLKAMTYLKKDPPVRLLIVGGDDDHTEEVQNLRRFSYEHGIQDMVRFEGRIEQEDLPAYYSSADIVVVPSRYESFGLVALESLSCGTPVVATRVGAMEAILRQGVTGLVVPNGSAQALAKAIETFLSRDCAASTDAIRASVRGFGWAEVASALLLEYEHLLARYGASVEFRYDGADLKSDSCM